MMRCFQPYDPTSEGGIHWNDLDIVVQWPKLDVPYKSSEKDEKHPSFKFQDFSWAEKWCDFPVLSEPNLY